MGKGNSKNTTALKYFSAAFKKWYESSGLNLVDAGAELNLSHTYISQLLRRKASISMGTAEEIATQLGTTLIDMLIEGRDISGDRPTNQNRGKDPYQEAKDAFDFVLLSGGEAAEILADQAIRLAKKKKAEAEFENPTPTQISKSA